VATIRQRSMRRDGSSSRLLSSSCWTPSTLNKAVKKYLNLTSYYGQQTEIDNQGRVLLPQILRGKASLDSDVTVFGKTTHLEVHNRAIFEQNLPDNEMTDADFQVLDNILSPGS